MLLCGRYEGVDERVASASGDREISIGDYVLSGGELPALVMVDAVARLVPGVVGDEESVSEDSFARGPAGLPAVHAAGGVRGATGADVLLSGHHAEIERWRRREALERTLDRRPDLIDAAGRAAGTGGRRAA